MTDAQLSLLYSAIAKALTGASDAFAQAAKDIAAPVQQAPVQQAPAQQAPVQQTAPTQQTNPWQQATSGNITPITQAAAPAPQFTEQDVMQRFQTISQRFGPDPITGEGGLLRTAGVQRVSELRADQYPAVIAHADRILAGQGGAA
jgi:hypothetical protein